MHEVARVRQWLHCRPTTPTAKGQVEAPKPVPGQTVRTALQHDGARLVSLHDLGNHLSTRGMWGTGVKGGGGGRTASKSV